MDRAQILSDLTTIMREYFDDETLVLTEDTTADEVEEWDSLSHVNIMAAVEQHFGIKIATAEVDHLKNVGELVNLIEKKTA
ncbi:acyl carrier protein [Sphingomonas nostoxanthinifaciens]|uniref:acyl carrier protein n=1 Tax=Sphingomonas nostoxanthinifaciens TaxID=2872652 RepID=UPI001CC21C6F|nr:acyl carrier protein [Sphingomonas nostoxanthinifaciens]